MSANTTPVAGAAVTVAAAAAATASSLSPPSEGGGGGGSGKLSASAGPGDETGEKGGSASAADQQPPPGGGRGPSPSPSASILRPPSMKYKLGSLSQESRESYASTISTGENQSSIPFSSFLFNLWWFLSRSPRHKRRSTGRLSRSRWHGQRGPLLRARHGCDGTWPWNAISTSPFVPDTRLWGKQLRLQHFSLFQGRRSKKIYPIFVYYCRRVPLS